MSVSENKARSLRGELYHAFTPELLAERRRCTKAVDRYNNAGDVTRRQQIKLWNDIVFDTTPLPAPASTPSEDETLLSDYPYITPPIHIDYGTNVRLGEGVFINFNCTIVDTCLVTIGARTLFAPNVSLYSGTHPLDPELRNGTQGPEMGGEISIGEDCWLGGNVTVLPGVRIGKGCTVGAGSVVTKDVPDYTVVAGNPARKLRDVPRNTVSEEEKKKILAIANET